MRLLIILSLCVVAGCGWKPETDDRRIVHAGDLAVLKHADMTEIPIALSKSDTHVLARATETGDQTTILQMVRDQKVTLIPVDSRVRVVDESFNERRVEVLDGAQTGKAGWVPFEWLKFTRG